MFDPVVPVGSHLSSSRSLGSNGVDPTRSVTGTLLPGEAAHTRHETVPSAPSSLLGHRDGDRVLPRLPAHVLGGVLEAGVLRAAEGEAAVVAAVPTEGVVAAPELPGHLLIGCPPPRHQDYVETSEAADGKEDQRDDAHHHH